MNAPEVRDLLSPMADRKVELSGPGYAVDRQRLMARIAQTRESERRQQRFKRLTVWAAAAAVVLAAGGLLSYKYSAPGSQLEVAVTQGSALQWTGGNSAEIAKSTPAHIAASGELETAAGSQANIRTAEGVKVELGAQTRVALGELQTKQRQLKLLRGAVRCAVPHQSAPERFQVLTPTATIVDIGTVFTVAVEGPDHATRVTVEEGEVLVRHASGEVHVKAPGSWSSVVATEAPAPSPVVPQPSVAAPEPDVSAPAPSTSAGTAPSRPRGAELRGATLDEETQLLRQGLAAERQGRFADARSALSTLLRKYPKSTVAPDARAALQRVEARQQQ